MSALIFLLLATQFTVRDWLGITTPLHTAVSPAGDRVAYTASTFDLDADVRHQMVWVVDAKGGTARKLFEGTGYESRAVPRWSPDGKRLAVPLQISVHEQAIFIVDAASGTSRRANPSGTSSDNFAWTSDSKSLAVVYAPFRPDQKSGVEIVEPAKPAPNTLALIDAASGASTTIDTGDTPADDAAFSPDGTRLAFSSSRDLYLLDLATNTKTRLTNDQDRESNPRWSPDGTRLLFIYASPRPQFLGVIAVDGKDRPHPVAEKFEYWLRNEEPRFYDWSADGKSVYFAGLVRQSQQLFSISLDDGAITQVTNVPGAAYGFSFSADRRTLAHIASEPHAPGEVFAGGKRITNLNPQLAEKEIAHADVFRWTSTDGLPLEGLVMFPPHYDKSRAYPTLVLMEGTYGTFDRSFTGRVSADVEWQTHFPFEQHAFAGEGYVVFMPNPRGSWSFGMEMQMKGRGDYGVGPYNDIVSGVDALVAAKIADPERLGIMGMGFDAYRTAYAIAHTTRFKAAAVDGVQFNLTSMYGALGPGFRGFFETMLGGTPWTAKEKYWELSPIANAASIKTPTLIVHPADAPEVWQGREMASALAKNEVPYQLVMYHTGNFGISEPKVLLDVMQRNIDWFNRWVK